MIRKLKTRSSAFVILALLLGSTAGGAIYYQAMFRPLQERVSDDGYGYVLEKVEEPNQMEAEAGLRALNRWEYTRADARYSLAVDIVRGNALYGLDGAQVIDKLGGAVNTRSDNYKRLKYQAQDKDHQMCDLYVTFDTQHIPKVIYSALFISGNSRDK